MSKPIPPRAFVLFVVLVLIPDTSELELPDTMVMKYPDPNDTLNFTLDITPDEGGYWRGCGHGPSLSRAWSRLSVAVWTPR
jgi:ubiquitin-conjugating enzyme E2 M